MQSARKDLFEKIIRVYPELSPKKRRVADLILKDHKKIFLMTAKEIAQECNVSEPTIIRFVNDLGFSGYMDFVKYWLQPSTKQRPSSAICCMVEVHSSLASAVGAM